MKQKKLAMLLAMALTFTQVAAIPVAAEDLTMGAVEEQEVMLDDSAEETTLDEDEDLTVEEDEELLIQDDTEVTVDAFQGQEEVTDDSAAEAVVESETELMVENIEEVSLLSDEEDGDEDDGDEEGYEFSMEYDGSITNFAAPNSSYKIWTALTSNGEEISDYRIEVTPIADTAAMASYEVKGTDIVVTTGSSAGLAQWKVEVFADEETGPVYSREYEFYISNYVILPEKITDADGNRINLGENGTINLDEMKPQIFSCDDTATPITGADYQIVLSECDEDEYWTRTVGEGQTLGTLTRKSSDKVCFVLSAQQYVEAEDEWQDIAKREYKFNSLAEDGWEADSSGGSHDVRKDEENSGYTLEIDFDPAENGTMMPNSDMKVNTALYKLADESYMTDYKLEIIEQSHYGTAKLINNDKDLDIKSGERFGTGYIYVSVKLPDENSQYKEIFRKRIPFTVNKYKLSPMGFANLKVGESIDLSKAGIKLMEYQFGKGLVEANNPNVKYIIYSGEYSDYDTTGWTLTPVKGQDLPIMTRTTSKRTYFAVMAWDETKPNGEQQIARKMYYFDPVEEPHTHDWKEGEVTKKATCTETGIRIATCACGKTKEVTLPIKDHTEVKDAAVAATCTTAGKTEGSHCSECGKVLVEQKTTSTKGHTEVKDAAVAPTALTEGKTEGSHCSVCGTVLKKQNTVAKLKPTVSLTASSLKLKTGQSTTKFKVAGLAAGDYVTKVVSADKKIVTVDDVKKNGTFKLIAGKKAGSTTVTVYLASSPKAAKSFKVTVQKGAVKTTKITTTTENLTLKKGETYKKLASSVTVAPVTSKEKITYSSSNKKVATVNAKGEIKAKKAGTAKITIKSGSKKVVVTVKVAKTKTRKLTGVPEAKTIKKGKSFTIKAVAAPKNTDEKITYKSSNPKVAKVTSKGVVKGLKKGTATITVKSGSQVKTCKVTVR